MTEQANRRGKPEEVNMLDLLRFVRSVWKPSAIVGFAFAVVTAGLSLLIQDVYEARVLTAIVESPDITELNSSLSSTVGGLGALVGLSRGGSDRNARLAILTSRDFVYGLIKKHKMMPLLFPDKWDETAQRWVVSDPEKIPTLWLGHRKVLSSVVTVSEDRTTGIVSVKVRHTDPAVAARWANMFVAEGNSYLRARALSEAERAIAYLLEQAENTTSAAINDMLYRVIERYYQRQALAFVRDQYAFDVLESAVEPERKVWPPRAIIVIAAAAVGSILAAVTVIVRRAFRQLRSDPPPL